MTTGKRITDIVLSLVFLLLLAPLILLLIVLQLMFQGRPVFYRGERMNTPTRAFNMWKFRSMEGEGDETGVTGGHKAHRISGFGQFLRRTRLDELPQLFNVLRGDMSLVGPRPPMREHVDCFPEVFRETLQCRPGLTVLSTVTCFRHEERVLVNCISMHQAERVYASSLLPRKAALERCYARHRSFFFDLWIVALSVQRVLAQPGLFRPGVVRSSSKVARRRGQPTRC